MATYQNNNILVCAVDFEIVVVVKLPMLNFDQMTCGISKSHVK